MIMNGRKLYINVVYEYYNREGGWGRLKFSALKRRLE